MSVQRLKQETTATEFITWMEYLTQQSYEYTRDQIFSAMIAAEVRRSWVKDAKSVRADDFMPDLRPKEPLTLEQASAQAKNFWLPFVGIKDY